MAHEKDKPDVGASIPLPAIIAALVTVAILAAGVFSYRHFSSTTTYPSIVIATGPDSGTYQALGTALQRVLQGTGLFERVSLHATDGSVVPVTAGRQPFLARHLIDDGERQHAVPTDRRMHVVQKQFFARDTLRRFVFHQRGEIN